MKKLFFLFFVILPFLIASPVQAKTWCYGAPPASCNHQGCGDCTLNDNIWDEANQCYHWSCEASCPTTPHDACTTSCASCPNGNSVSCPMIPSPTPACTWTSSGGSGPCGGSKACSDGGTKYCGPNEKIVWTHNTASPGGYPGCTDYDSSCNCSPDPSCVSPTPTPTRINTPTPTLTPTPTRINTPTPTLTPTSTPTRVPSLTPTPTTIIARCIRIVPNKPLNTLKIGDEVNFGIGYTDLGLLEDVAFRIFKDGQILETRFQSTYPAVPDFLRFRFTSPGRYSFAAYIKSGGVWR